MKRYKIVQFGDTFAVYQKVRFFCFHKWDYRSSSFNLKDAEDTCALLLKSEEAALKALKAQREHDRIEKALAKAKKPKFIRYYP